MCLNHKAASAIISKQKDRVVHSYTVYQHLSAMSQQDNGQLATEGCVHATSSSFRNTAKQSQQELAKSRVQITAARVVITTTYTPREGP